MASRFAWGIDVGNRALKAVKLVRDGAGGLRVDDVDIIEHEHILSDAGDNKESLITTALNTFAAKHPEKGGAVAIGVSGQSSFARFIKLPPVEPKKIPEIVRFEAIQQIPFPLDDVEWAYQLFQDEGSPDVEVGIFAMRKDLVNQHIANFTNAGLNVQVVQTNPLAVYNAMYYDQRLQKGTTMIVDVGAENTDLIISEGENVWLRSIPVGGNNFTEALVKQFKLKFAKAEDLKRNAATSKYTRQILQAMRPVFDNLVSEIQRSIGFYASVHRDSRIKQVVALGGTFRLPGLIKFLQMQLQLDVQRFDTLGAAPPADARVATLLNDNILSVVSPYGLALQAMGEGKISSSLLPQAIRRDRMWKEKTKWFGAAAALFVLGTSLPVGRYYYEQMQFNGQQSARGEIASQLQTAQGFATAWDEVEKSGEPERKQIASLQALTHLREVQSQIQLAIDNALPEPTTQPSGDRGARKVVMINDIAPGYYEDLTPALEKDTNGSFKMSTPDFNNNANLTPGQNTGGNATSGGFAKAKALAGVPPAAVAGGDGTATTGTKQRGYLITLTCTTPSKDWNAMQAMISDALVAQTKPEVGQKQPFRIERVELVTRAELKNIPPTNRVNQGAARRGNFVNNRRPAGAGFGQMPASDMEEWGGQPQFRPRNRLGAPAPAGARPGAPGARRGPGGAAAATPNAANPEEPPYYPMPTFDWKQLNADPAELGQPQFNPNQPQPVLDPITGEDAGNDMRMTFLVAVTLDPAPLAPPAPAGEDGAPAGEEAAPPPPPAEEATAPADTSSATAAR